MKKLSLLLAFFIVCIFYVQAQDNSNAQSILDKATAKIQSSKGISISFSLTQKDKFNKVAGTSKGILKIKGSKYYLKQGENEIFCNGIQIWNYDGESEVMVSKAADADDELSPQQIITGFNKSDFNIKLLSSTDANNQLVLTPVDKRKNFKQVILYVSKSTNLITKALITDKTNALTEIAFNKITFNSNFADNEFVFDPSQHPGVEIVNQ